MLGLFKQVAKFLVHDLDAEKSFFWELSNSITFALRPRMHLLVLRYISLKVGLSGVSIISPKCSSKPSKLVIIEIQTFSSFQQLLNLYISLLACKVLISALFLKVSLCKCMIWKPANLNWVWHVFGSEWIPLFWNLPCVSQQFSQLWFQSLNPPLTKLHLSSCTLIPRVPYELRSTLK